LQRSGSSRFEFQQGLVGVTGDALRIVDTTLSRDYLMLRDGNVGIGTSAPGTKLDVNGTVRSSISGGTPIFFLNNGTTQHSIQNTSGAFTFFNDGVERMRITSTGDLLVGTTSGYSLNGTNLICSSPTNCIFANTTAGAGSGWILFAGYSDAPDVNSIGTLRFRVTDNGNVTNTNNSYGGISDAKLKENIVDAGSQWNDLKAFQVRKFNFKEGQTHTQIGLIAQEVEQVSPGLVYETPDCDSEGNDLGTVTKSVNYSVLYMKAVKALQEAMERIENLEAKVAALEGV
jgi:hypothetical protein